MKISIQDDAGCELASAILTDIAPPPHDDMGAEFRAVSGATVTARAVLAARRAVRKGDESWYLARRVAELLGVDPDSPTGHARVEEAASFIASEIKQD